VLDGSRGAAAADLRKAEAVLRDAHFARLQQRQQLLEQQAMQVRECGAECDQAWHPDCAGQACRRPAFAALAAALFGVADVSQTRGLWHIPASEFQLAQSW
jgi:hypothetical protein